MRLHEFTDHNVLRDVHMRVPMRHASACLQLRVDDESMRVLRCVASGKSSCNVTKRKYEDRGAGTLKAPPYMASQATPACSHTEHGENLDNLSHA
jgi:hypothetical protein